MIDELVKEIRKSLDNGCDLVALISALTLPDICGKAEYPTGNNTSRYKKWYSNYIGEYERDEEDKAINAPFLSADIVYELRNSLLHEGDANINKKKCDLIHFELITENTSRGRLCVDNIEYQTVKDDNGNEIATNKKMSISVGRLCFLLCNTAEKYYNNNKEKFDFLNLNITNWDFRTKQMLTNPFKKGENK